MTETRFTVFKDFHQEILRYEQDYLKYGCSEKAGGRTPGTEHLEDKIAKVSETILRLEEFFPTEVAIIFWKIRLFDNHKYDALAEIRRRVDVLVAAEGCTGSKKE